MALEIDPQTCAVTLDRYAVAEDCGRVINPMIVGGQVHGAVAQDLGATLYEEIVYLGSQIEKMLIKNLK